MGRLDGKVTAVSGGAELPLGRVKLRLRCLQRLAFLLHLSHALQLPRLRRLHLCDLLLEERHELLLEHCALVRLRRLLLRRASPG